MMRSTRHTLTRLVVVGSVIAGGWTAGHDRPTQSLHLVAVDETAGGDATIAPDGRRFVTTSRRTGDWELWIYDIDRKRWSQVTHQAGEDFEAKWSPDGTRLVFTSSRDGQKDIWTVDLPTGAQRRLTFSRDDDEYPAWSPDGTSIVYTGGPWNARDFFIVPSSGGPARRITRVSGRAGACTFEPGGETVVCHRYDSGGGDVVRLWVTDGEEVPLTSGTGWDYKPTASPNGKFVAFSRSTEGPSHIWLVPAEGGRPWPLTAGRFDDRWPTWSGDSRRILFHRAIDDSLGVERLDRRDPAAPALVVPPSERPLQASLHPDGATIAYCSDADTGRRVKIRDIPTGHVQTIDAGGEEACYPRWSPEGQRLAFTVRHGGRWHVAVAARDGSALRVLTQARTDLRGMDGTIDWSPDGTRLIFHADTDPFEARIFSIDLASGVVTGVSGPGFFDESPSWSRNGRDILFMSTRGGNWTWALYRLNLRTGKVRPFTVPDWIEKNFPSESNDGAIVWTAADAHGASRLVEQRGGTAAVVARAGTGARWPTYSRDDRFITYTRMAHRVEFWIIENPATTETQAVAHSAAPAPREGPAVRRGGESPHGFHRR
jgi:TolB protein